MGPWYYCVKRGIDFSVTSVYDIAMPDKTVQVRAYPETIECLDVIRLLRKQPRLKTADILKEAVHEYHRRLTDETLKGQMQSAEHR